MVKNCIKLLKNHEKASENWSDTGKKIIKNVEKDVKNDIIIKKIVENHQKFCKNLKKVGRKR